MCVCVCGLSCILLVVYIYVVTDDVTIFAKYSDDQIIMLMMTVCMLSP